MSDTAPSILSKEGVISSVKEFIVNNFLFGQEDEPIAENDSFMEKGIIDSTGILELIDFTEETIDPVIELDRTSLEILNEEGKTIYDNIGGTTPIN